nr:DUF2442 domain-containing protein [Parerythrobacter jejuensis]
MRNLRLVDGCIEAELTDGGLVSVPIAWYPRLARAEVEALNNWRLHPGGGGIRWPDIDEDLSLDGMRRGAPSPET